MADHIDDISESIEEHSQNIDPTTVTTEKGITATEDNENVLPANETKCSGDALNDKNKANPKLDESEMKNVENKCNNEEKGNETNENVGKNFCINQIDSEILVQDADIGQNENINSKGGTCDNQVEICTTDVTFEPRKSLQSTSISDDLKEKNDTPASCDINLGTKSKTSIHTPVTDDEDSDEDIYLYLYPKENKEANTNDEVDNIKHGLQSSNLPVVPPPVPTAPRPPINLLESVREAVYDEIDYAEVPSSSIHVVRPALPTSPRPPYKSKHVDTAKEMFKPLRIIDPSNPGYKMVNASLDGRKKVLLDGVPKDISIKEIGVNIETALLTNSDNLEDIILHRTLGEAVLTLNSATVADELVKRGRSGETFLLKDSSVSILPYQEVSVDVSKIFLVGLNENSNTQEISNQIHAICGLPPVCVIKGEKPTIALLAFKTPQDLTQLQDKLKQSSEDTKLHTLPVERTRKVKVIAVKMETTPEELKHYFSQFSINGSVLSIKYRDEWKDYILTFSSVEDAELVVNTETHTVNDTEIQVSLYYPFLDGDEEYFVNIPVPLKLDDLSTYICRFLQDSPQSRKDIEEIIENHYGNIIWPDAGAERKVYVQCNIDERDRTATAKVRDWKRNVTGILSQLCKMFSVQFKYFAIEIKSQLQAKVEDIGATNPESVFIKFEINRVVIAGDRNMVDKLSDRIESMIQSIEQEFDNKGVALTQKMKLKPYELELLEVTNSIERLKDVDKKIENKTLIIKGRKKKIDCAIRDVKSILQDFPKLDLKDISPLVCGLLKTNKTSIYVRKKLIDSRCTGTWHFTEQGVLQMHSITKEDLGRAVECLRSCFRSTQLKIDARIKEHFQQGDYLANLVKQFAGAARYEFSGYELCIVTLDNVHDAAVEKIEKFIDLHTDVSEEFLLDPGQFRFIFSYKKKSIGEIVQQYKDMNVDIDVFDKPTRKGFTVNGERESCKTAIAHLRRFVIDGITRIDYTVKSEGLSKFLRTSEGINELNRIELSGKCVIRISTPDPEVFPSKVNRSILSACTIGTCEVQIMKGDITEAAVDFVVNPVDARTDKKYGLARTLIDKGGFGIQKDCQDHILRTKCLEDGDTFITSSGRLPCRGIIHVVLPTWAKVETNKEATISNAVTKCLLEAEKNEATSIAFPPLGAGRFRYPNDVIAERMSSSIKRYLMENGADTSLNYVYIYDVAKESSLFLVKAMRKELPLSTIMIPEMLTGVNDANVLSGEFLSPEIIIGSLVSQDTDVIVNTTNSELNLRIGSISKAILKEGGEEIESELKAKYQSGILPGEVAETKGGTLKCKTVFHGALVNWDHDQGHAERVMTCFVSNCLSAAAKRHYESIAFPVLAAGARSFPPVRVAKIMFNAVDEFKEGNPFSSLKTIRIVVQPENEEALQAFEEFKMPYDRQQRISKLSLIHNIQRCRPESVFIGNKVPNFTTKISKVTLSIEQGDITQANTAVIVNSVREDLNLDSGEISRSILRASGRSIQFQANEHKEKFKKDLLVTTSSGSLFCQKIIHVRARNGFEGWKRTFIKSLAEVEKMSLNSVAFPALGTGGKGFPVSEMARTMIHAFQKYINGENYQGCLKSIKIILYDAALVDEFTREVKAALKSEQRKSIFFKFWESKSTDDSTSMVFHIYTDTADTAGYVQSRIDQLNQEISKTK